MAFDAYSPQVFSNINLTARLTTVHMTASSCNNGSTGSLVTTSQANRTTSHTKTRFENALASRQLHGRSFAGPIHQALQQALLHIIHCIPNCEWGVQECDAPNIYQQEGLFSWRFTVRLNVTAGQWPKLVVCGFAVWLRTLWWTNGLLLIVSILLVWRGLVRAKLLRWPTMRVKILCMCYQNIVRDTEMKAHQGWWLMIKCFINQQTHLHFQLWHIGFLELKCLHWIMISHPINLS